MYKKSMILIMSVLMICLFAGPTLAKGNRGFGKLIKELNLTQEQKIEMVKLKGDKKNKKEVRQKMKNLREQMRAALQSNTSEEDLLKLHEKIKSERSSLADDRFKKMLAVRKILTPEQRVKFQELRKKRGGDRRRNRSNH